MNFLAVFKHPSDINIKPLCAKQLVGCDGLFNGKTMTSVTIEFENGDSYKYMKPKPPGSTVGFQFGKNPYGTGQILDQRKNENIKMNNVINGQITEEL